MLVLVSLLLTVGYAASAKHYSLSSTCQPVKTTDFKVSDAFCWQPVFLNVMPKTEENILLDNVCLTYFPLPDDPETYMLYVSQVYCDGSTSVQSFIDATVVPGVTRMASPLLVVTNHILGHAGCDTNVLYRCTNVGDMPSFVFGASFTCKPIGLNCLKRFEEIIRDNNLPDQDYYVLPMKLPNRCVTQQLCLQPPNPFYGRLA